MLLEKGNELFHILECAHGTKCDPNHTKKYATGAYVILLVAAKSLLERCSYVPRA
jgi:hypothetical protein